MVIPVARDDARCDNPQNLRRNGILRFCQQICPVALMCSSYLIISDIIVRAHALNLHGAQHPANVVDDLDVFSRCLRNSVSINAEESEF